MATAYALTDVGRPLVGRDIQIRCFGGSSYPARVIRFSDLGLYPMYLAEWTMDGGKVVSQWLRRDDFTL